jgi:acyl-lipid omega-6 desaturase (Delta-12 desaturase)
MRSAKELLIATRPYAHEQPWRSWWYLASTLAVYIVLCSLAASSLILPARISASFLAGLTLVRLFILFHDQQHGTIFRGSRLARGVMWVFGLLTLNPPSVWKSSHDHHHRNNSRDLSPNIGSFPLMTVEGYANASTLTRLAYRFSRHPLTMLMGYVTVFALGMCGMRLLANPRRHYDAALSLISHFGIVWLLSDDLLRMLLVWVLPFFIASGLGAYLFFVQHNCPGIRLKLEGQWNYVFSALKSSSYCQMSPLMHWFTGNIGYHHVHHLNAKIPFYRLPEAMGAIEELQCPPTTSFALSEVLACLRMKLWDPETGELVYWEPMRLRKAVAA